MINRRNKRAKRQTRHCEKSIAFRFLLRKPKRNEKNGTKPREDEERALLDEAEKNSEDSDYDKAYRIKPDKPTEKKAEVAKDTNEHNKRIQVVLDKLISKPETNNASEIRFSGASAPFNKLMRETYNNIPEHLREGVKQAKHKIVFGHHITQPDILPELAGVTPRGWHAGRTWDNNNCITEPDKKLVAVTEYIKAGNSFVKAPNPAGALRHEIAHVTDKCWSEDGKQFSDQDPFLDAYRLDVENMSTADRHLLSRQGGGCLQKGTAGREETFAEVLAYCIGGPRNDDQRAQIARSFPRIINLVKAEFDKRERIFLDKKKAQR